MASRFDDDTQRPLQWLFDIGEEAVQELLQRRGLANGIAGLAQEAVRTKGKVDKNVEAVLHLLNLPSRADHEKLLMKIEHLQGSLVNLNMKLDRVLAESGKPKRAARKAPKKPKN